MGLPPYTKPYLSVPEQVALLRARGLEITDQARAESCLQRIGYYRLSGYWFPFRDQRIVTDREGREERVLGDLFRPGSRFQDAMDLYVFDKKLRLLFMDAIERIEVGLRVDVALLLGGYGPLAHRDPGNFNAYFSSPGVDTGDSPHDRFLMKLDEAVAKSREDFALAYLRKYSTPMPIWMAIELWDFGTLTTILTGLKAKTLASLAARYGLPRSKLVVSWAQSINFVRNICAHHGRLWNRPPVQQPGLTGGAVPLLDHLSADEYAQRRVYAVAVAVQFLLRTIHPESTWGSRLADLVSSFPRVPELSPRQMGFPVNWYQQELWTSGTKRH